jgi:hypothetical protein
MNRQILEDLLALVDSQAEDMGLWGFAQTPEEEYLQLKLRDLHYAVETTARTLLEEETE